MLEHSPHGGLQESTSLAVTAIRSSKLPCEGDAAVARIDAAKEGAAILDVRITHADPAPAEANHASNGIIEIDIRYTVAAGKGAYLLSRNLLSSRRISMYNHTSVTNNPKAEYHSM